MSAIEYQTLFQISESGVREQKLWIFGAILMLGAIGAFSMRRRLAPEDWGRWRRVFGAVMAVLVIACAVLVATPQRDPATLSVVEGPVTNFKPMPFGGHGLESFCVRGKCFSYSDFIHTGGFNTTVSHGGPIREGLSVRVTFQGNLIVKLEVAKS